METTFRGVMRDQNMMTEIFTSPCTDDTKTIRVKLLSKAQPPDRDYERWTLRFPGKGRRMGRCEFVFEQESRNYDWLVVYDDLPRKPGARQPMWEESLACPRERTLLVTTEPSSIKLYGRGFLQQFGWVLSSQEPRYISHPRLIHRQAGLVWFYGAADGRGTHDALVARSEPMPKPKELSTVCSMKAMGHTLHGQRVRFTRRLKADLAGMEIFGHGVRPIADKADALDDFRYHIAIENHVAPHHWTEKLADPFLGFCLPFYHGAPNVADYFPDDSFIPIDIRKYGEARETIERAIRDNEWERRLPAIIEARRRVLAEHGTFPQLARLIEERHGHPAGGMDGGSILSRRLWRARHPVRAVGLLAEKGWVQLNGRMARWREQKG